METFLEKIRVYENGAVQIEHTNGDTEYIAADDEHGFSNFIGKQIPPDLKEKLFFIFLRIIEFIL